MNEITSGKCSNLGHQTHVFLQVVALSPNYTIPIVHAIFTRPLNPEYMQSIIFNNQCITFRQQTNFCRKFHPTDDFCVLQLLQKWSQLRNNSFVDLKSFQSYRIQCTAAIFHNKLQNFLRFNHIDEVACLPCCGSSTQLGYQMPEIHQNPMDLVSINSTATS